jgi:two-component system, OmpR family, sensor kinase
MTVRVHVPIKARLTLVFAILVAIVLASAGLFVFARFRHDLKESVDAGLSSRAETMLDGISETSSFLIGRGNLVDPDEAFAQIVTSNGEVLQSSSGIEDTLLLSKSAIAHVNEPTYFDKSVHTLEEPVNARLLAAPSSEELIVIVGVATDDQREAVSGLAKGLAFGGVGALIITTFIGWLVAGAALRPVDRMRAEAAAISADEPGRRLPVPDSGDEIARLGQTLNLMLDRLEEALERERRFVDDASHELRTPLGILKTELELALRRARSVEELEAALLSAAEESNRLNSLAEDLLVLARSDRGRLPVRRERTDLVFLANSVIARFASEAQRNSVALDLETTDTLAANVDPLRLRQALANLIDNALRYAPKGSSVSLRMSRDDGEVRIEVIDTGPGFPTEFLDQAFEPFARADVGRGRSTGGAGLGLAIVRAVAEAHGGTARILNHSTGGANVVLTFPA